MKELSLILALGFVHLNVLIELTSSLKVMELMAPYKIQSMANGRFLTASQHGILGLKTGAVTTQPYLNRKEQQWQIVWDPSMDDNHDGYRLESQDDYLNQVTTFYPDGSTIATANIWEIMELPKGVKMFRNKRTRKCLQVLSSKHRVLEKTCSVQNRFQHWHLQMLDLDKKIGDARRRQFVLRQVVPLRVIASRSSEEDEEAEDDVGDDQTEPDNSMESVEEY